MAIQKETFCILLAKLAASKDRVADNLILETYWEDLCQHENIEEVLLAARKKDFSSYGLPTISELDKMAKTMKSQADARELYRINAEKIKREDEEYLKSIEKKSQT